MIKKLRKKFILITMIVIVSVVVLIVGGTNFSNLKRVTEELDKVIEVISFNDGEMPVPTIPGQSVTEGDFDGRKELPIETPFKTRYFTVVCSDDETKVNTLNIFALNEDEAIEASNSIKNKSGFYKNYRYKVIEKEDSTMYIFVECEQELSHIRNVFLVSSLTGLLSIGIILFLIIVLSKIAVKPIAESYDKQKRFITDANHELKTPLTIISATNEIIEMKYGENEWSETINSQVKRLTDLTEKLVLLSKMEEDIKVDMNNVSVSSLIKEIANEFDVLKGAKKYVIEIEDGIEKVISRELFERFVRLLLDNAFKYSKDYIKVKLETNGKYTVFTVCNSVEHIEIGEHEELFERFYRPDESRSSQTGGSGIGLSVARSIAEVHKGKLRAYSSDDKTICFEFVF